MKSKLIVFLLLSSLLTFAQGQRETNIGASLSAELQKEDLFLRNLNLTVEEEVRLIDNIKGFDRSVTSLGLDYSFFEKRMKVGGYYAFIYLYNDKHYYEPRHRYYLNLSFKQPWQRYTFSWRGRVQGTYRDENRGAYKTNPKYIMKNKFEIEYSVWGRPWKPYISCDFSTELNNPIGNELTRIRYQGGTSWRLNRTDYLDFFMRFDNYFSDDDPHVFSVGVGYRLKM